MKKPLVTVLVCSVIAAGLIAAQNAKPTPSATPVATPAAAAKSPAPAPVATTPATPQGAPPPVATPAPATPSPGGVGKNTALISSDISGRDLLFLTSAIENGRVQLYLGDLAKTRAATEQVKAMGDVLSSTQADENKKLSRLAGMKGITIPEAEPAAKKSLAKKLESLTGPKFDKALMEEIVAANQRALSNYESAQQTKDSEIKSFVGVGLPMAKEKLLLVNKMSGTSVRSDKVPGFRNNAPAPVAP